MGKPRPEQVQKIADLMKDARDSHAARVLLEAACRNASDAEEAAAYQQWRES